MLLVIVVYPCCFDSAYYILINNNKLWLIKWLHKISHTQGGALTSHEWHSCARGVVYSSQRASTWLG
jgi:hypothetical protein